MRVSIVISSLIILILHSGCNTENEAKLVKPATFFQVLEGRGTDNPVAIRDLSDGTALIVSNSLSFEQGQEVRKIRLLKINQDGNIINERYLPEGNANWSVTDVVKLKNNEIILASTIVDDADQDSSLLFYRINENLDSVGSISHQNNAHYNLYGIAEDDKGLLFIAQEFKGQESYPIIGEISLDNSTIETVKKADKYDVAPATKVFRNSAGQFIWAYNRSKPYIATVQPNLLQINDQEVIVRNQSSVRAKELIMKGDQAVVFGELITSDNQFKIFYYDQASRASIVFGGPGDTHLNNVQAIDDGYLVTGFEDTRILGTENIRNNFFLSRRSANGAEVFSKTFGTDLDQQLTDAVMIDGQIYAIGKTIFGSENTLVLIKMDSFGRL